MLVLAVSISYVTFFFPAPRYNENLKIAINQLELGGSAFNPPVLGNTNLSRLDNLTDSIMLQLSMDDSVDTIAERAFNPTMLLGPEEARKGTTNQVIALRQIVLDQIPENNLNFSYGRYWHGYRTMIRIFGSFLTYNQLRVLNYILITILLSVCALCIAQLLGIRYAVCFALSLLFCAVYIVPMSLQFVAVFYIMCIGILGVFWLCRVFRARKWTIELFFLLGMLVAYFDFFTTPMVALGMPLIILISYWYQDDILPRTVTRRALICVLSWFVGYGLIWGIKIIATSLFFGVTVYEGAVSALAHWTLDHNGLSVGIITVVFRTAATIFGVSAYDHDLLTSNMWLFGASGLLVFLFCALMLSLYVKKIGCVSVFKTYYPFLLISLLPLFWQLFGLGHALGHASFTWRDWAVTLFALGAYGLKGFEAAINE